jgi:hypothetical protein
MREARLKRPEVRRGKRLFMRSCAVRLNRAQYFTKLFVVLRRLRIERDFDWMNTRHLAAIAMDFQGILIPHEWPARMLCMPIRHTLAQVALHRCIAL